MLEYITIPSTTLRQSHCLSVKVNKSQELPAGSCSFVNAADLTLRNSSELQFNATAEERQGGDEQGGWWERILPLSDPYSPADSDSIQAFSWGFHFFSSNMSASAIFILDLKGKVSLWRLVVGGGIRLYNEAPATPKRLRSRKLSTELSSKRKVLLFGCLIVVFCSN